MAKAILKWVGSKRAIVPDLIEHMPTTYNDYYEPFVGGASLYLALAPVSGTAYLSDLNDDLITTYRALRTHRPKLVKALDLLNEDWSEEAYYSIRSQHDLTDDVERAARFIYLNRYGYNGLVRYNSKGQFNVPWGHKDHPVALYDAANFKEVSKALRQAKLATQSYDAIKPKAGDFVYFDPPYHSTFDTYQKGGFGAEGQQALSEFCRKLDSDGVLFMLSNSDTEYIHELYSGFDIAYIQAPRFVSCRSDGRKPVREVLVTNYAR